MQIFPYLFFDGRCDEAIEFYRTALGAEVTMLMRMKDAPPDVQGQCAPAGAEEKVMHVTMRVGDTLLHASDGATGGMTFSGKPEFRGVSLSLTLTDPADAKRRFNALAEGGQVLMPLDKTFFSPCFGMVTDRFGVSWMVIVPGHE